LYTASGPFQVITLLSFHGIFNHHILPLGHTSTDQDNNYFTLIFFFEFIVQVIELHRGQ